MNLQTQLRDKTFSLLKNRPATLSLKKISEDTTLPESWLSMFLNDNIEDPSCNRIETLYGYLSGKPLNV